jgi:hypothetical protein
MNNPCISVVIDKTIVFKDKNSKPEFHITNINQRKIEKHSVDGCLIKGNEFKKCDWLAIDVETGKEVYIELKGGNISHAVEQLCATVEKLSIDRNITKLGYVICTHSPCTSPEIQAIAKKIKKSHKLILRVKTMQHKESIEKIIADLTE